jgi:hypothetical protein
MNTPHFLNTAALVVSVFAAGCSKTPDQTATQQIQKRLERKRETETNGIADPAAQQVQDRLRQRRESGATVRLGAVIIDGTNVPTTNIQVK